METNFAEPHIQSSYETGDRSRSRTAFGAVSMISTAGTEESPREHSPRFPLRRISPQPTNDTYDKINAFANPPTSRTSTCYVFIDPQPAELTQVSSPAATAWLPIKRKRKRPPETETLSRRSTLMSKYATEATVVSSNDTERGDSPAEPPISSHRMVDRQATSIIAWMPTLRNRETYSSFRQTKTVNQHSYTYRIAMVLTMCIKTFNLLISFPISLLLYIIVHCCGKRCPCHMVVMGVGTALNCVIATVMMYRNEEAVRNTLHKFDKDSSDLSAYGLIFIPSVYGMIFLYFTIAQGKYRQWTRGQLSQFFNINIAFVHGNTLIWILPVFSVLVSSMILGTFLILAHENTNTISKLGGLFGLFSLVSLAKNLVRMLMLSDHKVLKHIFPDELSQIEISNFLNKRLTIAVPEDFTEHMNFGVSARQSKQNSQFRKYSKLGKNVEIKPFTSQYF